jgi:hypothetical protein
VTFAFRVVGTALLLARLAAAQVTFSDGFEGTLLQSQTPAGQWANQTTTLYPSIVEVTAAAAHRGASGLRLTDSTALPATGAVGSALYRPISGSNAQHIRFWFRAGVLTSATNQWVNIAMIHAQSTNGAIAELYFDAQDKRLYAQAFGKTSTMPENRGVSFDASIWHLIELSAENMGTNSGKVSTAIDGQVSISFSGIDWSGAGYTGLFLGQPYATGQAIDDYRASAIAPASKLAFSVRPGVLRVGGCVSGLIELRTANDVAAPAPEAVLLNLSAPNFIFGPSCQTLGTPISIAQGASSAFFSVRADAPGMAPVRLSAADFIGTEFTATVVEGDAGEPGDAGPDASTPEPPDAGGPTETDAGSTPPPTPQNDAGLAADSGEAPQAKSATNYRVACGCDSGALACCAILPLLRLLTRRRT